MALATMKQVVTGVSVNRVTLAVTAAPTMSVMNQDVTIKGIANHLLMKLNSSSVTSVFAETVSVALIVQQK